MINQRYQHRKVTCLLCSIMLIVPVLLAGCDLLNVMGFVAGAGAGWAVNPPAPPQEDQFSETVSQQGNIGTAGNYNLEFFKNAEPAQRQIQGNNIPNVIKDLGRVLVLDITSWPPGWETGTVVVVRMPNGIIEYKRLIARFQLADGHLAIGVREAGLLEVVSGGTMNVDGDLGATESLTNTSNRTARLVTVVDVVDSRTFYIINENDVDLYKYQDSLANVLLEFPEIKLKVSPTIKLKLEIEKPWGLSDLWGDFVDFLVGVTETIGDLVDAVGGVIVEDEDGNVVAEVTEDDANAIVEGLLATKAIADKIEAVTSALADRTRIKEGLASVNGTINGKITFAATATAQYDRDWEQELGTVLIPIAGPIPIFLQFDVVGVASFTFDAQVKVTTGAEVSIPFYAGLRVINGELADLERPDDQPSFQFLTPSFGDGEDTRAELELAVGIQVEAGVTLGKLISATVDPTAEMVFDTSAQVTGDVSAGCLDLDWDLYARLSAELEAELSIPFVDTWEKSWDIPLEYTLLKGEWPNGTYEACWGTQEPEVPEVERDENARMNLENGQVVTSTTEPYPLEITGRIAKGGAAQGFEVIVVLDVSGSVDENEFALEKQGALALADTLNNNGTLAGPVGYAQFASTGVEVQALTTSYSVLSDAIQNRPRGGGGTAWGAGIDVALAMIAANDAVVPPTTAQEIIFFFTDGNSSDYQDAVTAAASKSWNGSPTPVIINTIGIDPIGNNFSNDTLKADLSDLTGGRNAIVNSFDDLPNITSLLPELSGVDSAVLSWSGPRGNGSRVLTADVGVGGYFSTTVDLYFGITTITLEGTLDDRISTVDFRDEVNIILQQSE